jgi:co-chaperonin GroES (HSP10)
MKVEGTIIPLADKVLVSDMDFGIERTKSGLYIPSDNGKRQGIHPRWGKVWAIGPEQQDVQVGDWVLVEHGRWTRTIEYNYNGETVELRMIDNNAILLSSSEKPSDVYREHD